MVDRGEVRADRGPPLPFPLPERHPPIPAEGDPVGQVQFPDGLRPHPPAERPVGNLPFRVVKALKVPGGKLNAGSYKH